VQRRRTEKGEERFDGSACAQADVALLDRTGNTNASDGMALVFPVRSGSARRFATPVEPPPFVLRFFVSLCETVCSAVSAPSVHSRVALAFSRWLL